MALKKVVDPNLFEPIVVNGCLIEPNTIYEIVPKEPSPGSNPVYQELKSMKERIPGVGNTITLTQADTGFFDGSPVFNNSDLTRNNWTLRSKLSKKYFEVFALPMKNYIADIDRIKIPTDSEFFDSIYPSGYLTVDLREGQQYDTSNPRDRFKLYIAIIEGELVMKGKREKEEKSQGLKDEHDYNSRDAQYCYISISKKKNQRQEKADLQMMLAHRFMEMLFTDKAGLLHILSYMNITVDKQYSQEELTTIYKEVIEKDRNKFKEFTMLLERLDKEGTKFVQEVELLAKLKTKAAKDVLNKQGGTYYLDDIPLGSNLKSVASLLLKNGNEEVYDKFMKLVDIV